MTHNLLTMSDAYKYSHFKMYPKKASIVEIYIEARLKGKTSTFAGLQAFLTDYLVGKVFTPADIYDADTLCTKMGIPFNKEGWTSMYEKYNGRLPIAIIAVPEGTRMPTDHPQCIVYNTDPEFYWLPGFLETIILRAIWYPSTVASRSRDIKDIIYNGLLETADDPDAEIGFKLHDFGARGVSSKESSEIGGLAHLYNFFGTDTVEAVEKAFKVFPETSTDESILVGTSIPAAEHSTITSWGKDNEAKAYENILDSYPTGLVAIVSDSYDIWNAITNIYGQELREKILTRDGTLVIRPDSGDPVNTPIKVIEKLMDQFGFETNTKGFKVLPPQIRVIQGDGIGIGEVYSIISQMIRKGLSVSNIAFGMGSGLLQDVNRDDLDYACKCSAIKIDGVWQDVFKDPVTDPGKKSKRGQLKLVNTPINGFETINKTNENWLDFEDVMEMIFKNGVLISRYTLAEVRKNAAM